MSSNRNIRHVTSISHVAALEQRLDHCDGSEDYVAVIRALVATRDPAAIRVLASPLDSVGPIAEESIAGLLTFGAAAIPAMRECVDSLDYEMIRHGHRVLAGLGDEASEQWLHDDDAERIEAYLDRKGFCDVECGDSIGRRAGSTPALSHFVSIGRHAGSTPALPPFESVANETDEEKGVA
jgi:hypothetical protein